MYKLDIRVDTKESAAIERRRIMEQQRQSRIFNARERTIGIDLDTVQKQVKEKEEQNLQEKQRDEAFASEMNRCDMVGELLDERKMKDRRDKTIQISEFRKENQRMEDRREFDIYDPDSKRKSLPARVSDDDPRLTVSGLQCFDGEDLEYERRKKLQNTQFRDWMLHQAAEKDRKESDEKHAKHLYYLKSCELDQRACELDEAEQMTRKALNRAVKEYNLALASEKMSQDQQKKVQEEDDNYTEICNNVHGDMLSENPEVAQSAFGSHRVVPDRWKGMSPQQVQDVLETQERQKLERKALDAKERSVDEEWDRQRVGEARAGMILESRFRKKEKELKLQMLEKNKQLAAEQRAKQEVLRKEMFECNASPGFFAQFNTTSR